MRDDISEGNYVTRIATWTLLLVTSATTAAAQTYPVVNGNGTLNSAFNGRLAKENAPAARESKRTTQTVAANRFSGCIPMQNGCSPSDLVVWRPSIGTWIGGTSATTPDPTSDIAKQWGNAALGDVALTGDLDGDGVSDLVTWRASEGNWYWLTSSTGYAYPGSGRQWGTAGDKPFLGDIDGDGKDDLIVWRPSDGTWFWLTSGTNYAYASAGAKQWGNSSYGDIPLIGDVDGDQRADLLVWRTQGDPTGQATWFWLYYLTSINGYDYQNADSKQWGNQSYGDIPLLGDIDGDRKSDLVVWRASTGFWHWLTSSTNYAYASQGAKQWGNAALGDVPLIGAIDGDSSAELVVWRASEGRWYWLTAASGYDYAAAGAKYLGGAVNTGDVPMPLGVKLLRHLPPDILTASGEFSNALAVAITRPTPGSTIRYTVDGTAPTDASPVYPSAHSTGLTFDSATLLRARSFLDGYAPSATAAADYTFKVAAPTVSPAPGSYTVEGTSMAVAFASATSNVTFVYTIDGSDPAQGGIPYNGTAAAIPLGTTTLRMRAFRVGMTMSDSLAAEYVVTQFQTQAPSLSPGADTYVAPLTITAQTATPNAAIFWTSDGSVPTQASNPYTGSIVISAVTTTTIRARAFRIGWADSVVVSATYVTMAQGTPTPVASPASGTFDIGQQVTLAGSLGSTIRYTLDGTVPTDASPLYVGPLTLTQPTTLSARAFNAQSAPSATLVSTYAIRVPLPSISPAGGTFQTPPMVTITTSASGAEIRYTTDRTEPTSTSTLYTAPFSADDYTVLTAAAFKSGWARSGSSVEVYFSTTATNVEETFTAGSVSLVGAAPGSTVSVGQQVGFALTGATYSTNATAVYVLNNGTEVPESHISRSSDRVTVFNSTGAGRNELELRAIDTNGNLVLDRQVVWAGNYNIFATIYAPNGAGLPGAMVTATLIADGTVSLSGVTDSTGHVTLGPLPPNEPYTLRASHAQYIATEFDVPAGSTAPWMTLSLDNNDFDQGLAGWFTTSARAGVVEHSEASVALVPCSDCVGRGSFQALAQPVEEAGAITNSVGWDGDLVIDTKNLAVPQSVTRRFYAGPGTTGIGVRYRFQSDEIWTAYRQTGVFQNDWFRIQIRNLTTGQQIAQQQTIGNLLSQFDANAATPWYTLTLPASFTWDDIEVTATVANSGDNAHMSILYVDAVTQTERAVSNVSLRDLIHNPDQYAAARDFKVITMLSASGMTTPEVTSYEGYVRIHGTITVSGPPTDSLTDIFIDVLENNVVRATGTLARATVSNVRATLLNQPFGDDGVVRITATTTGITPLLFEIPASQLANINQTTEDQQLQIRIRPVYASGVAIPPFDPRVRLTKLVAYTKTNRDGVARDLADCEGLSPTAELERNRPDFPCGGDSWVRPKPKKWAEAATTLAVGGVTYNVNWNDFSNMNGGRFPVHAQHRVGTEIDGDFDGYIRMNEAAADKMLDFLRRYYTGIVRVRVGYSTASKKKNAAGQNLPGCSITVPVSDTNPYWNKIKAAAALPDGRLPQNVIVNTAGHCDHFHVELDVTRIQ